MQKTTKCYAFRNFDLLSLCPLKQRPQGHPPQLGNSIKLFLRDAKGQRFEIDFLLKGID